jgi:tRNA (guanine37-N1)-methyltransferase
MKLKDSLKGILPEDELNLLVRAYDVVGDIAIIIIPPDLEKKESIIGETILKIRKNIKVVAKRNGNYRGEFRTIPLKIIAGENRKETEYKEYGVRFFLNPEKVYFSVRGSNERKRLATGIKAGEDVLIMFSGIGVYPLVIAKNSPAREIVGIEKNQVAHAYAMKSLQSNKRIRNVTLIEGDVADILPNLSREFDRIAMPLPKTGEMYLKLALSCLKKGGWLHFYDFQNENTFNDSIEKIKIACKKMSRTLLQSETVISGHSAPKTYRICVDAKIA